MRAQILSSPLARYSGFRLTLRCAVRQGPSHRRPGGSPRAGCPDLGRAAPAEEPGLQEPARDARSTISGSVLSCAASSKYWSALFRSRSSYSVCAISPTPIGRRATVRSRWEITTRVRAVFPVLAIASRRTAYTSSPAFPSGARSSWRRNTSGRWSRRRRTSRHS